MVIITINLLRWMKVMFGKKKLSNNNAVNEILGTILLLGISVSIFSIVYISVLTFPYTPSTPSSNIYFSLDETKVVLTHYGGKELDLESEVRIIIGDEPPITVNVSDFLDDEDVDNYWGFGEQFVYNDTTGAVLENSVVVTVIDIDSNSVVIIGKKLRTTNRAPVITSSSPSNGATGVSISISDLNINIFDPNSDNFDWTIETNPNIGSSSGTSESDGVKTCSISGLTEETTYTWYVNATDPSGSGEWTNNTYTFTTGTLTGNNPPSFSNVNPVNGTSDVSVDISSMSLTIEDPEGDLFDWTIETFPDIGSSTGNDDSNGSKSCSVSSLTYSTIYTWFVNATDGNSWTNNTYTFTTGSEPVWTLLTYDNFENGWGNYTDGGVDCELYTGGTYAYQGNNAADIQDDSDIASSFFYTNVRDVDAPGYTSIKIDLWFNTSGFGNGHAFIVKYWTGSTYAEIERLNYPTDFLNNQPYHKIIWINESEFAFPSDMKIKFECDSGNNNDDVYIDEIFVYVK